MLNRRPGMHRPPVEMQKIQNKGKRIFVTPTIISGVVQDGSHTLIMMPDNVIISEVMLFGNSSGVLDVFLMQPDSLTISASLAVEANTRKTYALGRQVLAKGTIIKLVASQSPIVYSFKVSINPETVRVIEDGV